MLEGPLRLKLELAMSLPPHSVGQPSHKDSSYSRNWKQTSLLEMSQSHIAEGIGKNEELQPFFCSQIYGPIKRTRVNPRPRVTPKPMLLPTLQY